MTSNTNTDTIYTPLTTTLYNNDTIKACNFLAEGTYIANDTDDDDDFDADDDDYCPFADLDEIPYMT